MRRACAWTALVLLCVPAAAPALAQTTPPGVERLYERYPVDPRAARVTEPPAEPADSSDDGLLGGLSPAAVAGLGAAVAVPLVLLGAGLARRRRDRIARPRAGNERFTPLRMRMAKVSPVENASGPIDLTTATEEQLCRLAGVGPALARRIVTLRANRGGFTSVDELAQVKGIGEARMEALRPYVRAQAPPAAGPAIPLAPRKAPRATSEASADKPRRRLAATLAQADRLKIALISLAVASQVLVVALVVWVF